MPRWKRPPPPARAACNPINDKRGTIVYRTKVAGVLLKRTVAIAAARAQGGTDPMAKTHITTSINGEPVEFLCEPHHSLLDVLRNTLGLTGTKEGCGTGDCGACSVTVDGRLVCACLVLAVEAEGAEIGTIEGMAQGETLHPLQQKFLEMAALQCGICTPGVLIVAPARCWRRTRTRPRPRCASAWPATCAAARATTRSSARCSRPPPRCGRPSMNVITDKLHVEDNKWIGTRTIRPDGADKVTGRATYAADNTMPGMIWGKVLRSPHAHARIRSIDTSKAEALPGVKAVVTAKDIVDFPLETSVMLGIQDMRWMCRNVMAREKALFHGHPIAAVAAINEEVAAAACALIEVDYEVLPHVIEIEEAIKPDAPILHDFAKFEGKPSNIAGTMTAKLGDVEAGFAEADIIVERTFRTRPIHQGYIEPQACTVSYSADGKATIWSSSQGQFMVRAMTSLLTGVSQSNIRAIPAEIGGGFGAKTIIYLEPVALLLSKKSGRPVKMVMTREEVMRATGPTSGSFSTVKIGAKKDGTFVAAKGDFYIQAGACRAGRCAGRSAVPSRPTISRTCSRSATTSSPTAPRSRPIARRAPRSAPMRPNAWWTRSPSSSAWTGWSSG